MIVIDLDFPVDIMCKNAWSGIAILLPDTALQSQEDEKLSTVLIYITLFELIF